MKKPIRLFSLLIALLLHVCLLFILKSSMTIIPIASTITRVTLLEILNEPIPPKATAVAAKSLAPIVKNTEVANFAQKAKAAAARLPSKPVNGEAISSKPAQAEETMISGLDMALSGTASTVATLPKGFSDKKVIAGLKPEVVEKRSALAKDLDKAVRADCKTAHQSLGILAPLALLHDTLRDKGCQW